MPRSHRYVVVLRTGGGLAVVLASMTLLALAVHSTAISGGGADGSTQNLTTDADPGAAAAPRTGASASTSPDAEPTRPAAGSERSRDLQAALALPTWPKTTPSTDDVADPGYVESLPRSAEWKALLGCSSATPRRTMDSCTFGDPDGRLAVVVGDSTAAFTMPAFRAMAERTGSGWQVLDLARFACPFTALDIEFAPASGCSEHRAEVLERLTALHPDLLLVMNTVSTVEVDGRPVSDTAWAAALGTLLERTRSAVGSIAVVVPNPPGPDMRTCVGPSSPLSCVTTPARCRTSAYRQIRDVDVVDTAPVWCVGGRCPATVGSDSCGWTVCT